MQDTRHDEIRQSAPRLWRYDGVLRPRFARAPRAYEESVWDYPRPPVVMADNRHVTVSLDGYLIAESVRCFRLLETASPPTFYIPRRDVFIERLAPARASSFCEWKGQACYWDVVVGHQYRSAAAWGYPEARNAYAELAECIAFYPSALDCYVDGEPVRGQRGGFYGGWVTHEIVGPYKGEPGTGAW